MNPTSFSISFVFPMYNERDVIEDTIREIQAVAGELASDYEIIIADDGSTDGSGEIIDRIAEENSHIKPVHLKENTKFGGALCAGLRAASKDIIIYTDSDLPVSFLDMKKSLSLIEDADIVSAFSSVKKGETLKRIIMSMVYNALVSVLFGLGIKDINSGYKIYRSYIFKNMELISQSPFIDVEIFFKAKEIGYRIRQFPLVFRQRSKGRSSISRMPVIWQMLVDMFGLRFKIYKRNKCVCFSYTDKHR